MFSRFGLLADGIIHYRGVTFILLVLFTGLMAVGHVDPYLILPESGSGTVVEEVATEAAVQEEVAVPPPNVRPVRVARGDVIVVVRSDHFFTPDGAEAIRAAVSALESLDQVDSILWMDRAPMMNLFGLPEPILPRRNASAARFEAARERALEHPLVGGQLMSMDAQTLLLMVDIDFLFVDTDEDCTDVLRDTAAQAASAFPDVPMMFQVTGNVPIGIHRIRSNRENEIKYQAIGYSMALLVAFFLFRGLTAVIIVAMAPAFGVFWTLGMLHFLGFDDNPFNSVIVPVLLCMVGFTDGVHMMVQIRRHRAAGKSAADAARLSIREVGLACWLTSLTTAIGFASLVMARHELVREFGYCCVIGVLLTFVSVITIIPIACASPLGRRVHSGYGRNMVDRNLERIAGLIDFVLRRHVSIGWLAIGVTLVLGLLTLQLSPDERLTSSLPRGSESAAALAHIDQALGGMETARVEIDWGPSVSSDDGELATVAGKVEAALKSEPLIGRPISIYSLLEALPGEGEAATRMSLLELMPAELKRAYYTPEERKAKVEFRLQDIGIASYGPVFERIEARIQQIREEHPDYSIALNGSAIWRWRDLFQVVMDLARSLGTASLIIFGVLTIVYRSLRIGLISVIPNIFPLAATGFLLLLLGQHLEIVSVCAFTVCLGIAVDDTIHFLTRYHEEAGPEVDRRVAIRRAFVGVGTALIMTTVVLVLGFATALLSDSRDHRIFAMMGMLTIASALFADLIFLPALLLRYAPTREPDSSLQSP